MLQAMAAGSVDVGGVGNAPPVFAAAGGDQLAIVGALQANPNGSALLVPKGSGIHDVQQLKGKRIAVAQGSSADYHLLTVLTKAGISVHDVTLVYLQPAAGLAALSSGHVDAWDIWSPFIEEGETLDGATAIVTGAGVRQPVLVHRRVPRRARGPGQGRRHPRLPGPARAGAPVGQTHLSAWAVVWAKASGLPSAVMRKGCRRLRCARGTHHARGGRLRAAGRGVHRQRPDPGPRELQPVRRRVIQRHGECLMRKDAP